MTQSVYDTTKAAFGLIHDSSPSISVLCISDIFLLCGGHCPLSPSNGDGYSKGSFSSFVHGLEDEVGCYRHRTSPSQRIRLLLAISMMYGSLYLTLISQLIKVLHVLLS